jgi:hypothetical protein
MTRPSQHSATRRMIRWIGFDRNPLRRRSDRVQTVFRLLAVAAALVALPLTIAVGAHVAGVENREARQQSGNRHLVTAVTTTAAASPAGYYNSDKATASVRWAYGGVAHTAVLAVDQGTAIGTSELLWVDSAGLPAAPPLSVYQAIGDGVFAGIGLAAGATAVLISVSALVALRLNRVRAAAWASEWALIEPRWAGRRT